MFSEIYGSPLLKVEFSKITLCTCMLTGWQQTLIFELQKKVLAEFYKNSCTASQKAMPLPAPSLTTNKTVDICDENSR